MLQSKTYYSYDERGNLSGEQTRTYTSEGLAGSTAEQAGLSNDANSVKTYHYDRFNRLVEYTDGDTVAKYEYNADNLRTAKTVNGRRTDYVWDGTNLRYETGGNGTHEYVYDPTGVHMMDGNYYVKDGHGNVTGMYDANAEFVSDTYYDAFGNITYGDAPNPFGYSGEYHDSETGLIYLRNRYYDSSTGRFITEDPAKDGVNWYSYCGGDPVNAVDPWGLTFITSDGTFIIDGVEYSARGNTVDTDLMSQSERVSVHETDDYINVYAYAEVASTRVQMPFKNDYDYNHQKELALQGIEDGWTGQYFNKPVITTVIEVVNVYDDAHQEVFTIQINNAMGVSQAFFTNNSTGMNLIDIYMGDSRDAYVYSDNEFKTVVAHEFGHVLGIKDLYNETNMDNHIYSIMGSEALDAGRAYAADFAMMMLFRGQSTGTWSNNKEYLRDEGVYVGL